jgi:hypothetical protein
MSKTTHKKVSANRHFDLDLNPVLHWIWLLSHGEQCRFRSAGTSMLSDQDSHCLLFGSLSYFWSSSEQCRSRSDGTDILFDLGLHWSHIRQNVYIWSKGLNQSDMRNKRKIFNLDLMILPVGQHWLKKYYLFFLICKLMCFRTGVSYITDSYRKSLCSQDGWWTRIDPQK